MTLGVTYMVQAFDFNADWGEYAVNEPLIFGVRLVVGTCQLNSFVFLSIGTYRIRKMIYASNLDKQINTRSMLLHVLSFSLYFTSGVLFYAAEVNFYTAPANSERAAEFVLILISCALICSFIA